MSRQTTFQMNFITKIRYIYTLLNKREFFLYGLVYLMFLILIPPLGTGGDNWFWIEWSSAILKNGIGNVYSSGSDYPPLYYYILQLFGLLKGSEDSIREYIFQLKYVTLIFEFCSIFILFYYIKKDLRPWFFIFIILNPGFFYNSVIWGQVDGILAFLLLSSIVLAMNRQNTLAMLLFIISLNFKVQTIIYLPLILFILIHNYNDYKGIVHSLYVISAMVTLETLIILPFINAGTTHELFNAVVNSVDRFPVVSMNAYNFWYWFFDNNPIEISDQKKWLNLTYKSWGLILFFFSSVIALMPLFIICISQIFLKIKEPFKYVDKVFLSAALISLLFFFCNTQMHERYSHYALIFLAGYFAVTKNYVPFLLVSFAYFLNMEDVLKVLKFPNYSVAIFTPEYIAGLYLIVIIYLYYLLYSKLNILGRIQILLSKIYSKTLSNIT